MTLPRKGSRKLVVGGVAYRVRISRWRRVSAWSPASLTLLDPRWLERARACGLGDTADVRFSIAVERFEHPVREGSGAARAVA